MREVVIAHHTSAGAEADELTRALATLGLGSRTLACEDGAGEAPTFAARLAASAGPCVLLISEALLHSPDCQLGMLAAYRTLRDRPEFRVVLAGGEGPAAGAAAVPPPSLSRVSDVIRYMNYWQGLYLHTRRNAGAAAPEGEETSDLAAVRQVSQEIGDTLRLVREDRPSTLVELMADDAAELAAWVGATAAADEPDRTRHVSPPPASPPPGAPALEPSAPPSPTSNPDPAPQISPTMSTPELTDPDAPERKGTPGRPAPDGGDDVEVPPALKELIDAAVAAAAAATSDLEPERTDGAAHDADPASRFVALLEGGDVAQAERFAREHLDANPEDHRLRYYLAVLLTRFSGGDAEGAEEEATRQLELLTDSPYGAAAHLLLGHERLEAGRYKPARRHFRQAWRLDRNVDPELAYRIGALAQDEFPHRRHEAVRFLRRAVKQSVDNVADAWYRLGQLHSEQGRWVQAVRAAKTALALDPAHPFAAYDLATLYLERDRTKRAARYFGEAITLNPELDTDANRAAFAPRTPELGEVDLDAGAGRRGDYPATRAVVVSEDLPAPLTVLITGASSGIGAATARAFARGGHRLILTGRRIERLRALSAELTQRHHSAVRLLGFDVTDRSATEHMLETLKEGGGEVDVLINNAGKARGVDPVNAGRIEDWEEMVDTNIKGVLYMTRLVSPGMVARRRGHIINVCSTAGHEVYAGGTVYCATKHAVDALTKGTRLDLHKYGIRVSQVSPAAVEETEFSEVRFDGDEQRAAAVYADFQPLRADDVAEAIYFIATRPAHVDVQDVLMLGTQQANSTTIDRSGR